MKRFMAILLVLIFALFMSACDSSSGDDGNENGDSGSIGDSGDKPNPGDSGSIGDSGDKPNPGDSGDKPDFGDSGDSGDSGDKPNPGDSGEIGDSGDKPNPDNSGDKPNPGGLDPATGLTWSAKASEKMKWDDAKTYCENLTEGDFEDWRLPTISELRTLIRECPETMTDGDCKVADDCLSFDSCWNEEKCMSAACVSEPYGRHSHFGDANFLWSSNLPTNLPEGGDFVDLILGVNFERGHIAVNNKNDPYFFRCVKNP